MNVVTSFHVLIGLSFSKYLSHDTDRWIHQFHSFHPLASRAHTQSVSQSMLLFVYQTFLGAKKLNARLFTAVLMLADADSFSFFCDLHWPVFWPLFCSGFFVSIKQESVNSCKSTCVINLSMQKGSASIYCSSWNFF